MKISIIIPAYNEEQRICSTLRKIKKRALYPENIEIIVVDGGSEDQTVAEAKKEDVAVIKASQKRRSIQMNEGAAAALGEIFYFLHADTHPPEQFDRHIMQAYHRGYATGCFQLSFDSGRRLLAFYGWCTRFDLDAFRFGDQSLFVRRNIFELAGGFCDDCYLMEGHELATRLKKDHSFTIMNKKVTTAARKYNAHGAFRLQMIYLVIFTLSKLGLEQEKLYALHQKWVQ